MNIDFRKYQEQARWTEQLTRQTRISKYIDFYNNDYESYIQSLLKKIFTKGYKLISKFIRKFPITERLIDDMSIVFKNSFKYNFNGTDNLKDLLDTIINNSNLYLSMITINRLMNLTYDIGVMPRWYNDKLFLDILTPDRCIVKQVLGFPTLIELLFYWNHSYTDSLTAKQINTMTKVTKLTISTVLIDSLGKITKLYDINTNIYGYIPVTWFYADVKYDSFWNEKLNPIIDMHIYYCIAKTYLSISLTYQAIATLITKGLPLNTLINFGPQFWIDLPKNNAAIDAAADAKYINPQTNFEAMYKSSLIILAHAAQYANLSAEAYKKAQLYSSGYQLELSKNDLLDYNRLQFSMFKRQLSLLFKMIIDTINIYSDIIISNLPVSIIIPLIKTLYSPELVRMQATWLLLNGIISPIDLLKNKHLNLTEQLLILLYNKNKLGFATTSV